MSNFKSNKSAVSAEMMRRVAEHAKGMSFQAKCPKCKGEITVSDGMNTCPLCNAEIDLSLIVERL